MTKVFYIDCYCKTAIRMYFLGSNIQPGNKKDTWSAWLSCSESCDGGLQSRARDVCPPELENTCTVIESRRCNEFSCDEIPSKLTFLCHSTVRFTYSDDYVH